MRREVMTGTDVLRAQYGDDRRLSARQALWAYRTKRSQVKFQKLGLAVNCRAAAYIGDAMIVGRLANSTGIQQGIWRRSLQRNPFEVLRMNDDLVKSQQQVADRFRALGLVPVDIKVADIVWPHSG